MTQNRPDTRVNNQAAAGATEEEIAYLAKRHRISPSIIREIVRRIGSSERAAVEREIRKGMMRR